MATFIVVGGMHCPILRDQVIGPPPVRPPQAQRIRNQIVVQPIGNQIVGQIPIPERNNPPIPPVANPGPPRQPVATTVWDTRRIFVTFPGKHVNVTAHDILICLNKRFEDSVAHVSLGQDKSGFRFATVLMREGYQANTVLGDLSYRFVNINGQWIKCRKFFNRYPLY